MLNVEHILDHAEQHCKARGSRLTPKRKKVLFGLVKSDRALSAYELIDVYKAEFGEDMPPMSVYRILEFLREESLVHRLALNKKYVACAHIACEHDHEASQFLICRECSAVKEIMLEDATVIELKDSIADAGFHLASPKLEINCVCNACAVSAQ